jgi:hypothetical protein
VKSRRFAIIAALIGFGLIGGFCAFEGMSSLVLLAADVLLHPGTFRNEESEVGHDLVVLMAAPTLLAALVTETAPPRT